MAAIAAAVGLFITAAVSWVGIAASRGQIEQSQLALEQEETEQANMITVWPDPQNNSDLIFANRSLDAISGATMTLTPARTTDGLSGRASGPSVHISFRAVAPCTQYRITLDDLKRDTSFASKTSKKTNSLEFHLIEFVDSSGHPWARDAQFALSDRADKRTDFDFEIGGQEALRVSWYALARGGADAKRVNKCGPAG